MMRILYVVSTLGRSGPNQILLNTLRFLDRERFEPIILTLSPEPPHSFYREFCEVAAHVESLGLSRFSGLLHAQAALDRFVGAHAPTIVQTQGIRADMLSTTLAGVVRRVAVLHNYPYDDYPMKYGRLLGTAMALTHLRALRRVDLAVACSNTVALALRPHRLPHLEVIQNGVDDQVFTPPSRLQRLECREKLGLPLDQKVFVSVGALIPRKDPLTVIRGFLASRATQQGVLVLVGDGPLADACRRLAMGDARILLAGRVQNVRDHLRAADYFISAALAEGLPNAVLEALACGVPVCLSDIAPHREILGSDGAGLLFARNDPGSLAAAINRLVSSDDQASISEAARRLVCHRFAARVMSRRFQDLYLAQQRSTMPMESAS